MSRDGAPHPLDQFRRAIEVNLILTFNMVSQFAARCATAKLIGEELSVIVNAASVAAYDGQIGRAAYFASKAGVVGMTLPIARDLAQLRIRIMTIAPGYIHNAHASGIASGRLKLTRTAGAASEQARGTK